MTRRRRRRASHLFEWAVHLGLVFVVLAALFEWHRIRREPKAPERPGAWPSGASGPAALVVDRAALERPGGTLAPFSARDWGFAWLNTLEQEIGPARVIGARGLVPDSLAGLSLVVLSAGASAALDASGVAALEAFVTAGGGLIAELPPGPLTGLTGVEGAAATPAAAHRPLEPDTAFVPPRAGLDRLPIYTRLAEGARLAPGTRVLARLSGRPVLVSRDVGAGRVVSVLCDFGLFLVATQQGRPEEDDTIASRYPGLLSDRLESNDLMVDSAYARSEVPLADLLERALLNEVRDRVLVPGFWYWPDGAPGVYLMSHDDEAWAQKGEWMPLDETTRGVRSTCFLVTDYGLGAGTPERLRNGGHAVGLHWNRYLERVAGLPKLGPWLEEIPVEAQAARLRGLLPAGAELRLNRLHYLAWMPHWTRPFRQLEAAGILLDSSYGPDFKCSGYLFGTAYPFRPLDTNGLPFRLYELPYQHSEMDGGADSLLLGRLARSSLAGDHAGIGSLFHPPFWLWTPSVAVFRFWQAAPGLMARAGHPATTLDDVLDFMTRRAAAALSVRPTGPEQWEIHAAVPAGAGGEVRLALPARLAGRPLTVLDRTVERRATLGGRELQLVSLAPVDLIRVRLEPANR